MDFRCFWGLPFFLFLLAGCGSRELSEQKKLVIGVVSYGKGSNTVEQYADLKTHLESRLKSIIEIEPAYNEVQAVQQIERQVWDVVFAPPGLAAIAISEEQYLPLLPQSGGETERSIIVVRQDSPVGKINDLANQTLALGQEGSATGYYLPVYNLYGLTLADIRFAPTPKTTLEWIQKGEVVAGALSVAELNRYRADFSSTQFRILYRDTHRVPSGAILVGPTIERNEQEQIRQALAAAPAPVAAAAAYITNAKPPDYSYLIKVVKRVRPIAKRIKEKPAPLY
jgi:phosphonate transport system substrate-binding protein